MDEQLIRRILNRVHESSNIFYDKHSMEVSTLIAVIASNWRKYGRATA